MVGCKKVHNVGCSQFVLVIIHLKKREELSCADYSHFMLVVIEVQKQDVKTFITCCF